MANPYQVMGTAVIVPVGGLTLEWSAVLTDGTTTTTLNSSDGPGAVLVAGTYSPTNFINHVAKKLRASFYVRADADPWVTAVGSEEDITTKLGFASTITPGLGANALRLILNLTGSHITGPSGLASIQSFSLVNTNNAWCYTGLARPGETRAISVSSGAVDDTGRFQPRWIFVFNSSFQDSGDYEEYPEEFNDILQDGSALQISTADAKFFRDVSYRTQPQHMAGPRRVVGRSDGTFGATRNILTLDRVDESLFTGISSTDRKTDFLVEHSYLYTGKYWARFRQTTGNTFVCNDVWPATLTPKDGEPIQVLSEMGALIEEWRRTGILFRFDPVDLDGTTSWLEKAYIPRVKGAWRVEPLRVSEGNIFWNVDLAMQLILNPGLSSP